MIAKPYRWRAFALGLTLGCAATLPLGAQGSCDDNPWQSGWKPDWKPIFRGIDWAGACTTRLPSDPNVPGVRTQKVNALRIDTQAPGIQFFTTPRSGTDYDTQGQVATEFLCGNNLQVAINANFSWPCCYYEPNPPSPNEYKLCGEAISQGRPVSELSSTPDPTYVGAAALLLTQANQAFFRIITAQTALLPPGVFTAVAGGPQLSGSGYCPQKPVPGPLMLVRDGVNQSCMDTDANPPEKVAARTAVGASQDGRYLYMLTIDGSDGTSQGAGFYDAAQWMIQLGAYQAINLDGGGSTVMVMQLPASTGGALIVSSPGERCCQRYVGNFLGVRAELLDAPYVPPGCGTRSCSQPAVSCGQ